MHCDGQVEAVTDARYVSVGALWLVISSVIQAVIGRRDKRPIACLGLDMFMRCIKMRKFFTGLKMVKGGEQVCLLALWKGSFLCSDVFFFSRQWRLDYELLSAIFTVKCIVCKEILWS